MEKCNIKFSAISALSDCTISNPSTNQVLKYDGSNWAIAQIDHTTLSSIGTNTHAQIDTFIGSKSNADGICPLDANAKVPSNNVSSIGLGDVDISTVENGDVLRYSNTTPKYSM